MMGEKSGGRDEREKCWRKTRARMKKSVVRLMSEKSVVGGSDEQEKCDEREKCGGRE